MGVGKVEHYTREYLQAEITALEDIIEDLLRVGTGPRGVLGNLILNRDV
jgi:hypothetical protein